jgi:hypothetical protein
MYVNFLVELGYNVKFIGDNFFPHQPYTKVLQRLGVEVFYGNYYANNWRDWILDNAMHIDVAYLHRPHIASKYIDLIKKHTKAKVVYQCHDLHHLRVGREAEVKDSQQLRDEAENLRKTEIELFKKADVGVTFSRDEREIIQQWSIDSKILQIPLYLYDSAVSAFPEFNKRSDILFVGGFNHTPNKEGLEWFIEFVLPLISIEIPSIVLHIVGGHSESLAIDCENKNVKIHGRLSDQELDNLYKHVKLSVLPLRYGAGVKGKLVESMYYQIPVVSTSIGLEGIKSDKYGLAAHDTAESFAKSIIKLVSDEQSWLQSAECSKFLFQDNFVKENLSHLIKEVF